MIYADNIIERGTFVLRNLNVNSTNNAADTWVSGTGYGFYDIPYEVPLMKDHIYYRRFTYKFTTTNQSPTWCTMYIQDGMNGGPSISNPVAGTEYTASNVQRPMWAACYTLDYGTMYNGNSNAISGVTSYVKNVICYDVTELNVLLRAKGIVTSDSSLKTWCDNNLEYRPRYTNYDISALVNETTSKLSIYKGTIVGNQFIEPDGMKFYSYSEGLRNNTWFDSGNGLSIYNNRGNGTVTFARVDAKEQGSPFWKEHPYVLKITTDGEASPYAGGFVAQHMSAANKVFIERFVAKIPVGYRVTYHYDPQGTGSSVYMITSAAGTGDWAEYAVLYNCGSSGSFSTGGHIALSGSNNTSVTWYVAYANNCDITSNTKLMNYTVLNNKVNIKDGLLFSNYIDTRNILPNGNCTKQETAMLPSGWTYDTTDYAGNATCSLVQPVGASAGTFGGRIKIDSSARYKVSYWVKCKGDMSSFLTAIYYYNDNNFGYNHNNTVYKSGTKTYLAAALNKGDTQMTVRSNANWGSWSHSRLGFRSSYWTSDCDDLGTSNGYSSTGLISGVEGSTIVKFNTAYTGATRASGTVVTETYAGSNYPYPIYKQYLPTDNTWKYVEGYFGAYNARWDGASNSGWAAIPAQATSMQLCLNIYSNTGTVPIKYSDIRIEQVSPNSGNRMEDKIQIKEES